MRARPPTDDEIDRLIRDVGLPVRLTSGDLAPVLIGFIGADDAHRIPHAMAEILRAAADAFEQSAEEDS